MYYTIENPFKITTKCYDSNSHNSHQRYLCCTIHKSDKESSFKAVYDDSMYDSYSFNIPDLVIRSEFESSSNKYTLSSDELSINLKPTSMPSLATQGSLSDEGSIEKDKRIELLNKLISFELTGDQDRFYDFYFASDSFSKHFDGNKSFLMGKSAVSTIYESIASTLFTHVEILEYSSKGSSDEINNSRRCG